MSASTWRANVFYVLQSPVAGIFNNPKRPPLFITSSGTFWRLENGAPVQIQVGGTSAAAPATWGQIGGFLSAQSDLQAALDAKAIQATSYVYQAQLAPYATQAQLSGYALVSTYVYQAQTTNYAWSSSLGTAASTAASTYAPAAQATNYAWSTSLAAYAQTSHRHDASHITSGVFDLIRLASTGTRDATTFLRGDSTWAAPAGGPGGYPSLTNYRVLMGATITLGANVYSTAVATTLSAGTWLVNGICLVGRNAAALTRMTARLTDGTNNFASGQQVLASGTSTYASIPLTALVTLGAASTVSMQAAVSSGAGTCFIRAETLNTPAGSTATQMTCVKIA